MARPLTLKNACIGPRIGIGFAFYLIMKKNKPFPSPRKAASVLLSTLLIAQNAFAAAKAPINVDEDDRLGLFIKQLEGYELTESERHVLEEDRLGVFIKHLEGRPLSNAEKRLLHDVDLVLEKQVLEEPTLDEKKLTRGERKLLAKVVGKILFTGITTNIAKLNPLRWVGLMEDPGVQDLSEKELTKSERNVLHLFASLVNRHALQPYLEAKLQTLSQVPLVGSSLKEDPSKIKLISEFAVSNIHGLVKTRGMTYDTRHVVYESWESIVARQKKDIQSGRTPFYNRVGTAYASDFQYLVDGPASFAKRGSILNQAKYNIDILVWAIQDDMTGEWIKEILLRKHREGVRVRLIVDGETAKRPGYGQDVSELAAKGIEVIRWSHPQYPYVGQHRKMIIVDGISMVAGGLNFGDHYSHLNRNADFWRDTDLFAQGDFVKNTAVSYFDKVWDEAAPRYWKSLSGKRRFGIVPKTNTRPVQMELVDHSPEKSQGQDSNIYKSIIADIMTAKYSVDIANAYVIVTDAFVEAVAQAVQRGVRVRILTNSEQSVDEPTLANAMISSAKKLKTVGADVYLRQGTTLHSKMMVVDGRRAHIMSYNLHPRSERMEGEISFIINDDQEGRRLQDIFERDIHDPKIAKRVNSPSEIKLKSGVMSWLLLRIMYDQL